jgi:hypothetical protein
MRVKSMTPGLFASLKNRSSRQNCFFAWQNGCDYRQWLHKITVFLAEMNLPETADSRDGT